MGFRTLGSYIPTCWLSLNAWLGESHAISKGAVWRAARDVLWKLAVCVLQLFMTYTLPSANPPFSGVKTTCWYEDFMVFPGAVVPSTMLHEDVGRTLGGSKTEDQPTNVNKTCGLNPPKSASRGPPLHPLSTEQRLASWRHRPVVPTEHEQKIDHVL